MKTVQPPPAVIDIHKYAIPQGAQYYAVTKSGIPCMFYRWNTTKYSDGTLGTRQEYFSFAGIWCGSEENGKDPEGFVQRLKRIHEKPGYTVSYHTLKKEWGVMSRFDEYVKTKEELDVMVERIKGDPAIKLAYYQQEHCSLGVFIKKD